MILSTDSSIGAQDLGMMVRFMLFTLLCSLGS